MLIGIRASCQKADSEIPWTNNYTCRFKILFYISLILQRNIMYNAVIPENHNPGQLGFKCKYLYNCLKEREYHTMSVIAVGNVHILLLFTIYPT